ncbi:MAG: sensor histidine kinase [Caldilineaceae bacterium]|nr:sensor histidine kinase [Caldilineaceae bacterium]HRJ41630.1 sensor histidine kinase [Caldilineaceae bacterium]
MTTATRYLKTFWQLLTNPSPDQREVLGEGRPFFLFLTLILASISILVAYNTPTLHAPLRLVSFALVMLLHISLHWLSGFTLKNRVWSIVYLLVQGLLGLTAVLLSSAPAIALAVFSAMIGETIGNFGTTRYSWLAVGLFLVLTPISFFVIGGTELLTAWVQPITSTMIMLIIFMVLFRRQLDTGQRAQALAAELEVANRRLADYAAQVEELTLTAERQRMARELHDILSQGVAGLVLQLEAVKAHLAAGRHGRAGEIVVQSLTHARATLTDSRAAIDDLRALPVHLEESLHSQVERFTQATGIPCKLEIALDDAPTLSAEIGEHIQRIISEALANITRHAQASLVKVGLGFVNGCWEVEISDNGRGFDPATPIGAGHYGLLGMRERARLNGGKLAIESGSGQGTRIHLAIPAISVDPTPGESR